MESNKPKIVYNQGENWWGSIPEGIANTAKLAKKNGQKTLLKPHFWVDNVGWAGDLSFSNKKWEKWEENYTSFILKMARMAESLNIEMLCIGVELKSSVTYRSKFWKTLIPKIRAVYGGKLIYSSNWDNYRNVPFWHLVDYIGIDAYFPLSTQVNPNQSILLKKWEKWEKILSRFSAKKDRHIIFTEIGYRSIDRGAGNQWETENLPSNVSVNLALQANAFEAFFRTCWDEDWFAGSFIWEWHPDDEVAGGKEHSNFTPQHKPAEQVIKQWFGKK